MAIAYRQRARGGFNIRQTRQATKVKKSGKHRTVLIVDTL